MIGYLSIDLKSHPGRRSYCSACSNLYASEAWTSCRQGEWLVTLTRGKNNVFTCRPQVDIIVALTGGSVKSLCKFQAGDPINRLGVF